MKKDHAASQPSLACRSSQPFVVTAQGRPATRSREGLPRLRQSSKLRTHGTQQTATRTSKRHRHRRPVPGGGAGLTGLNATNVSAGTSTHFAPCLFLWRSSGNQRDETSSAARNAFDRRFSAGVLGRFHGASGRRFGVFGQGRQPPTQTAVQGTAQRHFRARAGVADARHSALLMPLPFDWAQTPVARGVELVRSLHPGSEP